MHKSVTAVLFVIAAASSSGVMAAGSGWKSSYEGGRYEFFSDKSDMRIYIACPTADSSPDALSSVRLSRLSTRNEVSKFQIIANGNTYDGPIETSSRVGSENFKALMRDLRQGGAVVKYALGSIAYPQASAAKFFPAVDRKFPCQTTF